MCHKSRLLLILLMCYLPLAQASAYQNLQLVRQQVREFLLNKPELSSGNDTRVKVNAIDPRLKLTACDKLSFDLATGSRLSGKVSVKVQCQKPKAWSFYVTTHVSRFEEVFITNSALHRGQIISAADVYKSRKDLSTLAFGYMTDASEVIGMQARRHIQPGRVLIPSQLTAPVVIKRGDIISLQKESTGFAISMKGTALADGAIGDRIRVKNSSSKRIVEGTISQAGVVEIGK